MTVLDLITDMFLQIGAINQGDTPNASEAAQASAMVMQWSPQSVAARTVVCTQTSVVTPHTSSV